MATLSLIFFENISFAGLFHHDLLSVALFADTTNAEWRSKTAKQKARKVDPND